MAYKNRQSVLLNQHSSVEVYEGIMAQYGSVKAESRVN